MLQFAPRCIHQCPYCRARARVRAILFSADHRPGANSHNLHRKWPDRSGSGLSRQHPERSRPHSGHAAARDMSSPPPGFKVLQTYRVAGAVQGDFEGLGSVSADAILRRWRSNVRSARRRTGTADPKRLYSRARRKTYRTDTRQKLPHAQKGEVRAAHRR